MNKRDKVEVEAAFLEFIEVAESLGFRFSDSSDRLHLQHVDYTPNDMAGKIVLDIFDYKVKD